MEWKKVGKHWRFDKTIIEEWLLRHPERMASKPETSMPAPGSGGHAKAGTGK